MEPLNILVIDDEPVICDGCRLVLSDAGHRVETHVSGCAGLDAFFQGRFDVVLLDLKLPDADGMEILEAIHGRNPNVYVVVMTGYSTVSNAIAAMKGGAFDFLSKPFSDDELNIAMERVMENRRLVMENLSMRRQLTEPFRFDNIIGENPAILNIFEQIKKVAPTDSTVLIYGESGTGKELFARAIHAHSQRAAHQFVALDCSTLASGVLESELFGHVRGAFSGAVKDKPGIFEVASAGTLFLDEISGLSLEIQGKLLRVMESGEFKRVGATAMQKTNARIIAASNRDLKAMVSAGAFREDLFYRLSVFPIFIPPLRERRDDIPRLASHFLKLFNKKTSKRIDGFTDEAMNLLVNQDWPGNVRQLKNVVERLVILSDRRFLDIVYLLDNLQSRPGTAAPTVPKSLAELKAAKQQLLEETFGQIEKAFILKALQETKGNISRAAAKVGMQRPNFHALMRKHGISGDQV
ncbi:MAG: sigma-54-dependent Fis family transcriptional regulator [Deltaproteobacteria bacterium]|nr:sigma-54-dependent Fis family transcriptional regulator [Deltaproteobacteria bacterium]